MEGPFCSANLDNILLHDILSIRLLHMSLTARPPAAVTDRFVSSLLNSITSLTALRLKDLEQLTFCLLFLCDVTQMRQIRHAMTR